MAHSAQVDIAKDLIRNIYASCSSTPGLSLEDALDMADSIIYSDEWEAICQRIGEELGTASDEDEDSVPAEPSKPAKYRSMENGELESYAKSLGIDVTGIWSEHTSVYRMRLIMAIRAIDPTIIQPTE